MNMHTVRRFFTVFALAFSSLCLAAASAFAQPATEAAIGTPDATSAVDSDKDSFLLAPTTTEEWMDYHKDSEAGPFSSAHLLLYGWAAGLKGDVGAGSLVAPVDISFSDILQNLDMVLMFSTDFRVKRFGFLMDFIYIELGPDVQDVSRPFFSIDGISVEEVLWSAALYYRLKEWKTGYFDVLAGGRYVYLRTGLDLTPDARGISTFSENASAAVTNKLTNTVQSRINAAIPLLESQLKNKDREEIIDRLTRRIGGGSNPIDPDRIPPNLGKLVRAIVAERLAAKAEAVAAAGSEARKKASAARMRAQEQVDKAQKQLADDLDERITDSIPNSVESSAAWVDPFIGMRMVQYLTENIYLALYGDIGGFGVSSDLTWQAGGGIGVRTSERIALELFYRYLDIDYDRKFVYDVSMGGLFLGMRIAL